VDIANRRVFFISLIVGLVVVSAGVVGVLALRPGQSDHPPAVSGPADVERVLVHSLGDAQQANRLEGLLQVRRTLQSNEAVLARIHAHAVQQIALINRALQRQFDIDPGGHYSYDKPTHTVYRLTASKPAANTTPTAEAAAAPAPQPQRQFHRRLASEEEQRQFIGLYVQKQQLLECVVVFGRALGAQRRQLQQCNQVLTAEFNVEPDRQYAIDSANDAVYEIRVGNPTAEIQTQVARLPMEDKPTVVR
jgi:hypothetical protein